MSSLALCASCGRMVEDRGLLPVGALRESLIARLPAAARAGDEAMICGSCVADLRTQEIRGRLSEGRDRLTALEEDLVREIAEGASVVAHLDETFASSASPAQRLADTVARVGGSWRFVLGSLAAILCWMLVNSYALTHGFDPYPFILLNLILSSVAALQAPIIMMSQNRAAARDRLQAEQDFRVNLKAEHEIASLHAKIDHLLRTRWDDLMELQELQLERLQALEEGLRQRAEDDAAAGGRAAKT